MPFQYTLSFFALSLTAVISGMLAYQVWQRPAAPGRTFFASMMVAVSAYALIAALESAAIARSIKIFWSTLESIGSGSVIVCFLLFAMAFTAPRRTISPCTVALLCVPPLFNVGLVATNAWHGLVWTGFLPSARSNNTLVYLHGPGFTWVMMCIYAYVLAGSFLLVRAAWRSPPLHRQQTGFVLAGAVVPLLGSTTYLLGLAPGHWNLTPISFMITGLIYCVGVFRFRLFDLVPVARDLLVEQMPDGVLLLDTSHRILDINPAAQTLLESVSLEVGQQVEVLLLERWPGVGGLLRETYQERTEIVLDAESHRCLELRLSLLRDRRGRLTARLLLLRDITQRYQVERELRRVNEQLQSHLLEIEVLHATLQEQAIRDGLTQVFNRRYFEETLPRELHRAARGDYPVSVILLDIDYFKRINDTFGHKGGDRVLKAFGELLLSETSSGDMACRYGGEEFALAFPGMSLEDAQQRAEKIRARFQDQRIVVGKDEIRATVSGGVATYPFHGKTSDDLMQSADKALYAAKEEGRNRICLAQDRPST